MDIIIKADKYLNGNHYLLNIIFSYLGQSPSAKVIGELTNDGEMNAVLNKSWYYRELSYPQLYFRMRKFSFLDGNWRWFKQYTPLSIPRFKVDVLSIEDDVDCERCNRLLNYNERENYGGYCEYCYGKVHHLGRESDEEPEPDTDTDDSDEWGSETDED
jgi:hypothetical protein